MMTEQAAAPVVSLDLAGYPVCLCCGVRTNKAYAGWPAAHPCWSCGLPMGGLPPGANPDVKLSALQRAVGDVQAEVERLRRGLRVIAETDDVRCDESAGRARRILEGREP